MFSPPYIDVHDVRVTANNFIRFVKAGNCPDNATTTAARLAYYAGAVHASRAHRDLRGLEFDRTEGEELVYRVAAAAGLDPAQDMQITVRPDDARIAYEWLATEDLTPDDTAT